jgi:hypothetical protein
MESLWFWSLDRWGRTQGSGKRKRRIWAPSQTRNWTHATTQARTPYLVHDPADGQRMQGIHAHRHGARLASSLPRRTVEPSVVSRGNEQGSCPTPPNWLLAEETMSRARALALACKRLSSPFLVSGIHTLRHRSPTDAPVSEKCLIIRGRGDS